MLEQEQSATPNSGVETSPPPPAETPPSGDAAPAALTIPEGFTYKTADGGIDFEALNAALAERDALKADRPEAADKYDIRLDGEPLTYADGSTVEIRSDDPAWADARKTFHEAGLSQKQVDALVGFYARLNKEQFDSQYAEQQDALAEEMAALVDRTIPDSKVAADKVVQRLSSLESWLTSTYGEDGKRFAASVKTAAGVRVLEALREAASMSPGFAPGTGGTSPANTPFWQRDGYYKSSNRS